MRFWLPGGSLVVITHEPQTLSPTGKLRSMGVGMGIGVCMGAFYVGATLNRKT